MKAHGISSNNSGRAGSPSPSGPSTPANVVGSKSMPKSSSKKRKMAALGDDLDDEVKSEIKTEVKQEVKQNVISDEIDGPHTINPTEAPYDTAGVNVLMTMAGRTYSGDSANVYGDDDVLLVSERQRDCGTPMPSVAYFQQMILPPAPDNFYGFVDHATSNHLASPTIATTTTAVVPQEHDADHPLKMLPHSEPAARHWPHHHKSAFF